MATDAFAELGLHQSYCRTVAELGFTQPSDIQRQAIPHLLEHKDLLGLAQTGTGKTAAFGLPLLQNLVKAAANIKNKLRAKPRHPRALILAPTRELALQIDAEMQRLGAGSQMKYACVIGGVNQNPQVKKLRGGVDILVAAPGRLLDLMNQGHVDLSETKFLVLDECDRLLDMGFIPDVRRITQQLPKERQTLLFSATVSKEIEKLAKELLHKPVRVDVSPKQLTVAKIEQNAVMVATPNKRAVLEHLLREQSLTRAIVFTRTKHGANKVARQLNSSGFVAEAIHGNKTQAARQKALANFKNGDAWILVATDIAARGIDVKEVSHVINYELPHEPESYVHRIGRTGRAGAVGVAWALVDGAEISRMRAIERLTKERMSVQKLDIELPKVADEPNAPPPKNKRKANDAAAAERRPRKRGRTKRPASEAKQGGKASSERDSAQPEDQRAQSKGQRAQSSDQSQSKGEGTKPRRPNTSRRRRTEAMS